MIFHKYEHQNAWAQGNGYFGDSDLDYWREGKKVKSFVPLNSPLNKPLNTHLRWQEFQPPTLEKSKPLPTGSIIRQSDALPFDWKNYEDPKSPEFWDDGGDYVAPRPLREAVANPTPENLEKYANWQAKRLIVIAQFNQKLVAHTLAKGAAPSSPVSAQKATSIQKPPNNVSLREVSLMYFYQSSCPHCQAEKEHVEELKRRGVQVTFVQLDADENPPLHSPSVPYSEPLSKQFGITATPTWIFRWRENSVRLQGKQSEYAVNQEISKLANPQSNQANQSNERQTSFNKQGVSP